MNEHKFTMRTGSLVRLARSLSYQIFITEDCHCNGLGILDVDKDTVRVELLDIGMVVDDLIEEEEEHHVLVLFNEKIVRANCRVLRRVI